MISRRTKSATCTRCTTSASAEVSGQHRNHDITAYLRCYTACRPETGVSLQIRSLTKRRVSWLWALLPLLLAAALAIPLLDVDAFNGDELASLLASGILRYRPMVPLQDSLE